MTIGRDSTGFEDIDEFWDAEVTVPTPVPSVKLVSGHSKNRESRDSNTSFNSETESFDYDTSDSIEEEENEEQEKEEAVNQNLRSDNERNPKLVSKHDRKSAANAAENNLSPNRRFRGSSVGGRDSLISNFTLESSLGGTLPLEDSDEEDNGNENNSYIGNEGEVEGEGEREIGLKGSAVERFSLDSLYEQRSINEDIVRRDSQDGTEKGKNKNTGRINSFSSVRDGAKGRVGKIEKEEKINNDNNNNGDSDDGDSVDTTDMSAIPSDSFDTIDGGNNIEIGDENPDFGEDFQDTFDHTGLEDEQGEFTGRRSSNKKRLSSIDKKINRRVSFGEGTKPEEEKEKEEEEEMGDDNDHMGAEVYDDNLGKNEDSNHGNNDNEDESKKIEIETNIKAKQITKSKKSITPSHMHITPVRADSRSSSSSSSTGAMYSMGTTPGSNEFARGRVISDESFVEEQDGTGLRNSESESDSEGDGDGEGDEGDADISYVEDTSFLKAIKSRIEKSNEGGGNYNRRDSRASTDQEEEDEEEEEEEDKSNGTRRSSRVTKGKRLAYWRGERPVYQKGRMVGMLVADKTPLKPRKQMNLINRKRKNSKVGIKSDQTDSEDEESNRDHVMKKGKRIINDEDEKVEIIFPKNLTFLKREIADELSIWDDPSEAPKTLKVVCHCESLQPPSALPITAVRPAGKERVGYAAQSFNVPEIVGVMSGWISGFVELPAGAIKDAEGVGECSQVFFVSECQDDGVELGIADPKEEEWKDDIAQRILLRKGDSFFVPPGNIYRLENHSTTTRCTLFWTIVRPMDQIQNQT